MDMKSTALFAAALALAGCASYDGRGLTPGMSTEAEVRGAMGPPAVVFDNPDGSRRMAYPRGPLGTDTFMADIGADGRVISVRNVLNDETFYRVQPGMTRDDILRLIGPPGETMSFSHSGRYAWDYRFVDTWGYRAIFSVTFDSNGVVLSKISQRIERERRGGL
ncbi:MAG TPA: outer membrane protein assembly factor BamE [Usitatibacter sp.]|nr:outer membrane protein assembly factor BamE [Usitatibacter sp.]